MCRRSRSCRLWRKGSLRRGPCGGHEMLEALRGSNGVVQTVTEEEIWGALEILWRTGTVGADESVVLYLTGSGLMSTETIARHFAGRF